MPAFRPTSFFSTLCVGSSLAFATLVMASPASEQSEAAQARFQKDRAACMAGNSNQDRQTCLYEARSVLRDSLKRDLDAGNAKYDQNATERCKQLPASEQDACRDRMKGDGTTSGSVLQGGVYRELTVTEPAPQAKPQTPTPTQPRK